MIQIDKTASNAHFNHNLTHKYLDPKINLSEFRQILCETYAPQSDP